MKDVWESIKSFFTVEEDPRGVDFITAFLAVPVYVFKFMLGFDMPDVAHGVLNLLIVMYLLLFDGMGYVILCVLVLCQVYMDKSKDKFKAVQDSIKKIIEE